MALSPGESVVFGFGEIVGSLSFHRNFVCVRVFRDEVFCGGIEFNRIESLPIASLSDLDTALLQNRFNELENTLEHQGKLVQERTLNVILSSLLHAADCKLAWRY